MINHFHCKKTNDLNTGLRITVKRLWELQQSGRTAVPESLLHSSAVRSFLWVRGWVAGQVNASSQEQQGEQEESLSHSKGGKWNCLHTHKNKDNSTARTALTDWSWLLSCSHTLFFMQANGGGGCRQEVVQHLAYLSLFLSLQ